MKKSAILLMVLITLMITLLSCRGEDQISGDYHYTILADGTAEIQKYTGSDTEIEIPSLIEDLPVTSIGDSSFYRNESIQKVTLPDGIISVKNAAFGECTELRNVYLPEGLLTLGEYAFQGCVQLESVTLPRSLVWIGENPFDRCTLIEDIDLPEDHPFYLVENGVLFDRQAGRLITYPSGKQDTEYTVPEWISEIGMAAFSENSWLKELTLPDEIAVLEGNPFCGCKELTAIHVAPWNLFFEVNAGALFQKQTHQLIAYLFGTNVNDYIIPNGVISIAREAFYKHTELHSIRIPKSVTLIGDAAFAESGLKEIRLPNTVIHLGSGTFSDCKDLEKVTLPENLAFLGDSVFNGCSSLKEIKLPETLNAIGSGAFLRCTSLTSVTIPESVRIIENYAFALCDNLTSAKFPEKLYSIGNGSFYGDQDLVATVYKDSLAEEWALSLDIKIEYVNLPYVSGQTV